MRSLRFGFGFTALASTLLLGCGGGDATAPVQRAPATLQATSPTSVSAAVATTVNVAVIVRDASGAPLEGATVSFSVLGGGGSVSPSSAVTNATGAASAAWVLGTVPGPNDLRAAISGLQVSFAATAATGPASLVAKISGDNQQGPAGSAVAQPLKVRVTDSYQNPVESIAVTFAVTSGGGSIQGSPVTTDSEGVASAGPWTLGAATTAQTVSASINSASVQFLATADLSAPPNQCSTTAVTIGSSLTGALEPGDCEVTDGVIDTYQLVTPQQQSVAIALTSTAFAPKVTVSQSGQPTAGSDDVGSGGITYCDFESPPSGCHTPSSSEPGSPVRVLLAAGSRLITVGSNSKNAAGSYSLSVAGASSLVANCETVFVERGVTTTQQLEATDCGVSYGATIAYYSDDMKIHLTAGSQLRVRMSSSAFVPWLDFFSPTGSWINACVNPGIADCTFTIPTTGYYLLAPSSFAERGTGAYTLTVD